MPLELRQTQSRKQSLMTEALEQIAIRKLALDEVHAQLGASMTERDGWSVPASYGDVAQEYAAVREAGAGLIDLSSRGRLLVSGSEAVQFLNGLITNDMKTLAQKLDAGSISECSGQTDCQRACHSLKG